MTYDATTIATPVGRLAMVARGDVLRVSGFAPPAALADRLGVEIVERRDLGALSTAMAAYFDGDLAAIDDLPVSQPGAEFFQAAWKAMRAVPAGETITYTELALRAGNPNAIRAAANACARNLVAPVVPCHRIVRSGGALGGYYYGLATKDWLLAHEGRHAARRRAG